MAGGSARRGPGFRSVLRRAVVGIRFAVGRAAWDSVLFTEPVAEVDHFAALGAEGPEGIVLPLDLGAALRASPERRRHRRPRLAPATSSLTVTAGTEEVAALDLLRTDSAVVPQGYLAYRGMHGVAAALDALAQCFHVGQALLSASQAFEGNAYLALQPALL